MSNSSHLDRYYEAACEFTVPIRLHTPIWLEPEVIVTPLPCVSKKLPVYLEPEIYLQTEVKAALPSCLEDSCTSNCETPAYEECEPENPEECLSVIPKKRAFLQICSVLLLLLCLSAIVHSFA